MSTQEHVLVEYKSDNGRKETHGGGDWKLAEGFLNSLQSDYKKVPLTNACASLESHLVAFAAEKSGMERQTINMEEFRLID